MSLKKHLVCALLILVTLTGISQNGSDLKWWDPTKEGFHAIEGQAWADEVINPYDRLPKRAKDGVREPVWNLSKHAAGFMLRFRSNAESITVRYTVGGNHAMNHMPATGVSGVDLYAIGSDGDLRWCRGSRNFSDTIVYQYNGLAANDQYHHQGREYRLYLPLYNSVEWMEVGVDQEALFNPLPVRTEKPLVVYGTSIAHGACASRPGMAWTGILQRELDRPLINLAFSGNGRLEKELIELLTEIDAKIYVLDCLPNLTNAETYDDQELKKRILESVQLLKEKRPETPVLLVEHAGYTDGLIQLSRAQSYIRVNKIQKAAFDQLKSAGIEGLYYLTKEEIGLQLDDMVDGTHPNDLGMMHYAKGYEKALRSILDEPIGMTTTTRPCIQYREPGNYDWEVRHREILKMNKATPPKTVLFANSIIHFWGGAPKTKIAREEESWSDLFTPMGVRNSAYGWDRIENVLWRIYHGELDGFQAEKVVVMIGTNNLHLNSDEEILAGLEMIMGAIKARQPNSEVLFMGILPRREQEVRVKKLNALIEQLCLDSNVQYADIGTIFLKEDKLLNESLFSDGLHPNKAGYLRMRHLMQPILVPD